MDFQRANIEMGGIPGTSRKYLISYVVLLYIGLEAAKTMDAYAAMKRAVSNKSPYKQLITALLICDFARDLINDLSILDRKDSPVPVLETEEIVFKEIDSAYSYLFRELADKAFAEYEGVDFIRDLLSAEDDLFVLYGLRLAKDYMERKSKEIGAESTLLLFDEYLIRIARLNDSSPFNREFARSLLPLSLRVSLDKSL